MQNPLIDEIQSHVEKGILSSELCPTPNYWHWDVLNPDALSPRLADIYQDLGEIRWYGQL